MEVVALQLDVAWQDKADNIARAGRLLDRAGVSAGSLVVLPEMFSTGFTMNAPAAAEGDDRQAETFLADTARRFGVTMVAGVVGMGPDGRGRNQAVAFDAAGAEIARYEKMHLFSPAGEADHYGAGEKIITFSWAGFTACPLICYDLRFPEIFRAAVRRGTNLFVVIANWPRPREAHWLVLAKARAIENQAYVIAVNRCGHDPNNTFGGRSLIVDPRGNILTEAGDCPCVVRGRFNLQALEAYRRQFPALQDMRRQEPF